MNPIGSDRPGSDGNQHGASNKDVARLVFIGTPGGRFVAEGDPGDLYEALAEGREVPAWELRDHVREGTQQSRLRRLLLRRWINEPRHQDDKSLERVLLVHGAFTVSYAS